MSKKHRTKGKKTLIPGTVKYFDKDDKDVPEAVKRIRKKLDSSKFEQIKEGEYQEVISGKRRDLIQKQVAFRSMYLKRKLLEETLLEMQKCIQDNNTMHEIKQDVKYRNIDYPYDLFIAKFNVELHNLSISLSDEKVNIEFLKKQGMTEEQINDMVKTGTYLKEHPEEKKKKEENDANKAKELDKDKKIKSRS